MARRRGKKYRKLQEAAEDKIYELSEAIAFLKEHPAAAFDETVELAFRLSVDTTKSDQTVRGTVGLPHGSGKAVRVLVFATGAAADAAKEAGSDS